MYETTLNQPIHLIHKFYLIHWMFCPNCSLMDSQRSLLSNTICPEITTHFQSLTLSWQRSLSYQNQSIDFLCKFSKLKNLWSKFSFSYFGNFLSKKVINVAIRQSSILRHLSSAQKRFSRKCYLQHWLSTWHQAKTWVCLSVTMTLETQLCWVQSDFLLLLLQRVTLLHSTIQITLALLN